MSRIEIDGSRVPGFGAPGVLYNLEHPVYRDQAARWLWKQKHPGEPEPFTAPALFIRWGKDPGWGFVDERDKKFYRTQALAGDPVSDVEGLKAILIDVGAEVLEAVRRKKKLERAEEIRKKLEAWRAELDQIEAECKVEPAPRYDEVFFEGTRAFDSGPDSFPGTDEDSHFMSQTRIVSKT